MFLRAVNGFSHWTIIRLLVSILYSSFLHISELQRFKGFVLLVHSCVLMFVCQLLEMFTLHFGTHLSGLPSGTYLLWTLIVQDLPLIFASHFAACSNQFHSSVSQVLLYTYSTCCAIVGRATSRSHSTLYLSRSLQTSKCNYFCYSSYPHFFGWGKWVSGKVCEK